MISATYYDQIGKAPLAKHCNMFFKYFFFFGVPHLATFIFDILFYVIASIGYIHPVYGAGVWTHNLLIMSCLP